ncbi:MAG TPA: response regulator [Rhodothermales bacterium]|nr:response regulator [Rhodothermales bacterium]
MYRPEHQPALILLAEDDPDDRMLAMRAFEESRLANTIHCVEDGEELLDYLNRTGVYAHPAHAPRPDLILLDLNMPRKDGREALEEIKADPEFRRIPVVALTTSQEEEDVSRLYDLGVNAFVTKPITFDGLCRAIKALGHFWFDIVQLPRFY